jgi:hypothetical protein
MDFVFKLWGWLNGKKTVLGAVATFILVVADQLGTLLPLLGVQGAVIAKILSVATLVVGLIHKAIKALQ